MSKIQPPDLLGRTFRASPSYELVLFDRLLAKDARDTIPDERFTRRVMQALPAPGVRTRPWLKPALILGSAALGSARRCRARTTHTARMRNGSPVSQRIAAPHSTTALPAGSLAL